MNIFEQLEADMQAWIYALETWFCPDCPNEGKEVWHVRAAGMNSWNDEPWTVQYSFDTQADAWDKLKELGTEWMQKS